MTVLLVSLAFMAAPAEAHTYPGCNTNRCAARVQRRQHARTTRRWHTIVRPHRAHLDRIARCESGGRWNIATGNGYFGGLQFSLRSWAAVGGSGYPHRATALEQRYRGVRLAHLQGWGAWPVCGAR